MVLNEMFKEEWRLHSKVYDSKYLLLMPLLMFSLSFLGSNLISRFSAGPRTDIGLLIMAFGFFTGVATGSVSFSNNDAVKNVLNKYTFLIFSSRTLPIDHSVLRGYLILKDIIFYMGMYFLPIGIGVNLALGGMIPYTAYMIGLFITALITTLLLADRIDSLPARSSIIGYKDFSGSPLLKKSLIDISRSSGGFVKIIFSLLSLMGLYWFIINYVPIASYLGTNPLSSFSIILGTSSVTIYNLLNTYDDKSDYSYLYINQDRILSQKLKSFKILSTAVITAFMILGYLIYGGNILTGFAFSLGTSYYIGVALAYLAGPYPNERMSEGLTSLKFLVMTNIFIIPMLGFSSMNTGTLKALMILVPMVAIAKITEKYILYKH